MKVEDKEKWKTQATGYITASTQRIPTIYVPYKSITNEKKAKSKKNQKQTNNHFCFLNSVYPCTFLLTYTLSSSRDVT